MRDNQCGSWSEHVWSDPNAEMCDCGRTQWVPDETDKAAQLAETLETDKAAKLAEMFDLLLDSLLAGYNVSIPTDASWSDMTREIARTLAERAISGEVGPNEYVYVCGFKP